jgi:hypothetical protein
LGERLDLGLRKAGEYDPELRDLQDIQGLLRLPVQARLPGLIAINHQLSAFSSQLSAKQGLGWPLIADG